VRLSTSKGWLSWTPSSIGRARKAARQGNWSIATRYYEQFLHARPDDAAVWTQYGHALKEYGDPAGAERAYRMSLDLRPNPDTYVHLGYILLASSRLAEAASEFAQALKIDDDFVAAHDGLSAAGISPGEIDSSADLRDPGALPETMASARTRIAQGSLQPSLALAPVAHGQNLQSAVAEAITTCGGTYPSLCVVAADQRRVVGWAFLPFDFHQTVLVNVYHQGRLIACTLANRTRPADVAAAPRYSWFEIIWSDWQVSLTRAQIAELTVQRGEDGRLWQDARDRSSCPVGVDALAAAELFDELPVEPVPSALHRLSAQDIVQLYYLDYLGRPADSGGLRGHVGALEQDAVTIDDFRYQLLRSEEFRNREVRAHDRLGRMSMMRSLALHEQIPFEQHAPLRHYEQLAIAELAGDDNAKFVDACYTKILRRKPYRRARPELLASLKGRQISRLDVMRELVLEAAAGGRFIEVVGLARYLGEADHILAPQDLRYGAE